MDQDLSRSQVSSEGAPPTQQPPQNPPKSPQPPQSSPPQPSKSSRKIWIIVGCSVGMLAFNCDRWYCSCRNTFRN